MFKLHQSCNWNLKQIPIIQPEKNPWQSKMHLNINRDNRPFHITISSPSIHLCPQNEKKKKREKKYRGVSTFYRNPMHRGMPKARSLSGVVYFNTTTSSHWNLLVGTPKKSHFQYTVFLSKINRMLNNKLKLLAPDLQFSKEISLNLKKKKRSLEVKNTWERILKGSLHTTN